MLSFVSSLLRDLPIIVSHEKQIPCTCASVHCERYHGLPPFNPPPNRSESPLVLGNYWQPVEKIRVPRDKKSQTPKPPFWTRPSWPDDPSLNEMVSVPVGEVDISADEWIRLVKLCHELDIPLTFFLPQPSFRYDRRPRKPRKSRRKEVEPRGLDTTTPEGWTAKQIVDVIAEHSWDDETQAAVFMVVFEGLKPKQVATERNLPVRRIYGYSQIVRQELEARLPQNYTADEENKAFMS